MLPVLNALGNANKIANIVFDLQEHVRSLERDTNA